MNDEIEINYKDTEEAPVAAESRCLSSMSMLKRLRTLIPLVLFLAGLCLMVVCFRTPAKKSISIQVGE